METKQEGGEKKWKSIVPNQSLNQRKKKGILVVDEFWSVGIFFGHVGMGGETDHKAETITLIQF